MLASTAHIRWWTLPPSHVLVTIWYFACVLCIFVVKALCELTLTGKNMWSGRGWNTRPNTLCIILHLPGIFLQSYQSSSYHYLPDTSWWGVGPIVLHSELNTRPKASLSLAVCAICTMLQKLSVLCPFHRLSLLNNILFKDTKWCY